MQRILIEDTCVEKKRYKSDFVFSSKMANNQNILYCMKIKLLTLLAAVVCAANMGAQNVAKVGSTEYASFATALSNWTSGTTLQLLADIEYADPITVDNKTVTLDLNGHGIRHTGVEGLFCVVNGGNLTLNDSDPTTEHKFSIGENGFATLNEASGTLTINGGYLTGGIGCNNTAYLRTAEYKDGGAFFIYNGSTVTMNGGTLIGNGEAANSRTGGAVFIARNGHFILNGGTITRNRARFGGGISLYGGRTSADIATQAPSVLEIHGGEISYNYAFGNSAGVHTNGYSVTETVIIDGGSIINNIVPADAKAAGLYVEHDNTTLYLSGNPVIKDNLRGTYQENIRIKTGTIHVNGALTNTEPVHVFMETPSVFTTDLSGNGNASDFASDNSGYGVKINGSGEAEMIQCIDADFAIDFRSNPYTVVGGGSLPTGVEVTGSWHDGQHGYSTPVITIPVTAGNYLVKMGTCQYSHQDGTITNEDGSVTYATLATNTGVCYDANPSSNYVATIITVPNNQLIKVNGAEFTPYFAIQKMPEIPAFTDFELNFRNDPYIITSGALPTGSNIAGSYHDEYHGYQNVVATIPVKAGNYRLTLGACQFSTNNGSVMSETNVQLASFNQNLGDGNCYHNNTTTNIISMTFAVDIDQHIIITCGQYTPYMKLEKISAYTVTFALGDAEGVAPAVVNVTIGDAITIPVNKTMYKEGYTLSGWTDGVNTYAIGDAFTPASDITLTPVFAANEADLLNASSEVTVKWFFGESNGAPSVHWEGSAGFLIAQATIGTKTVDVKLVINGTSGKFQNSGRGDQWAQVNANTVFTFPYKEGMTVDVNTYSGNATYDLVGGTLTCNTGDYYSYLELTFPAPADFAITANVDPQHAGVYYSTFYHSGADYTLPAGVEAYKAVISGDALNLTKVAVTGQTIPSGNAVILKSSVQNYTLIASAATSGSLGENSLLGTDAATLVSSVVSSGICYVLSGTDTEGVGFFTYAADKTLKAHKAYVVLGGGAGAPKRLRFVFDAATGVEQITNDQSPITNKVIRDGQLIIIRNGVEYNANGQIVK